jgi:hypothetical protein
MNQAEKDKMIAKARAERDAAIAAANDRYRLRVETIAWADGEEPSSGTTNGTHREPRIKVIPRTGKVAFPLRPAAFSGETARRVREALASMPATFTIEDVLKYVSSHGRTVLRDPAMTALKRAVKNGVVERIKVGDAHNPSVYNLIGKKGSTVPMTRRYRGSRRAARRSLVATHQKP